MKQKKQGIFYSREYKYFLLIFRKARPLQFEIKNSVQYDTIIPREYLNETKVNVEVIP